MWADAEWLRGESGLISEVRRTEEAVHDYPFCVLLYFYSRLIRFCRRYFALSLSEMSRAFFN